MTHTELHMQCNQLQMHRLKKKRRKKNEKNEQISNVKNKSQLHYINLSE